MERGLGEICGSEQLPTRLVGWQHPAPDAAVGVVGFSHPFLLPLGWDKSIGLGRQICLIFYYVGDIII